MGESFVRLGYEIAGNVVDFLKERESDTRALAEIIKGTERSRWEELLLEYQQGKQSEIWYNTNTDMYPVEERETIPIYNHLTLP